MWDEEVYMIRTRRVPVTGFVPVLIVALALLNGGCGSDGGSNPIGTSSPPQGSSGIIFLPAPGVEAAVPLGETSVTKTLGSNGGELCLGEIRVRFPSRSLAGPTELTLSRTDDEYVRIRIEPSDLVLLSPATMKFEDLDKTDFGKLPRVSIYRYEAGTQVRLPSRVDGDEVEAETPALGDFVLTGEDESGQQIEFIRWLHGAGHETALIEAGEGGTITYDRFKVQIPEDALNQDTYITVREPGNGYLMCELEPHGIQFNIPVTLEMDLDDLETAPYFDWTIFWLDDLTGLWVDQNAVYGGDKLVVRLSHFSRYAAGRAGW